MTVKNLSYGKINRVNPLYLTTDKANEINEYIEEWNANEYLTLVPTDESKNSKKCKELWK